MSQAVQGHRDGRVIVKSSDTMWSTGEGNGNPLQYSCLENPKGSMKRQKDMTLKDETPPPRQIRRCPVCCWGSMEGNY